MNLIDLKSKIITKDIPNFMVFTGPESGVLDIYLKQISKVLNLKISKVDTVESVIKNCSGNSLFKITKLFVVTDDMNFIKDDSGWNKIQSLLGKNKLILRYHNYDSRLGFWKKFEDITVMFNYMPTEVLANNLAKQYNLDLQRCAILAKNCANDYTRCLIELDKVEQFSKIKHISLENSFDKCLNNGVLSLDIDMNLDDFVSAFLTKNYEKILILQQYFKRSSEPVVKILNLLYNSFKGILIAQTIHSAKNIQQNTGLNYYAYIKAKENSGYYNNSEIEYILYILMKLEQGIKTGLIAEDLVMDYLISVL